MDRVTWLKTLWQYNFKSPAHLRRMSFIVHYQKFKEFWIWKYVAKIFLIFQAFFINLWSRGKHSWLWNQGSCVQIPAVPFLFLSENVGFTGNRTRGLRNPKSAMLTFRPPRLKFWCKKISVCNSTGWETWRPPPRGNKLENNLGGIGLKTNLVPNVLKLTKKRNIMTIKPR